MPEKLFDPTIHQSMEPLEGYRFDHASLVSKLDALKKEPTEDMKAWLAQHPEYKSFNCTALAAYSGLSEPTLKKLKAGQIADPRGSTFWILFNKFGIRPRDVLKCIPENICSVDCVNQTMTKLKAAQGRIEEYERQHAGNNVELERLRKLVLEKGEALSAAQARAETSDNNRDDLVLVRNTLYKERAESRRIRIVLIAMCAVAIIALGAAVYLLWDATHPGAGIIRY